MHLNYIKYTKMTKQTILDAVREELLSTNKLCSLGDGFSETDYTCLGMVSAALDKVDFDTGGIKTAWIFG